MPARAYPALVLLALLASTAQAADRIAFWDMPRHGGNSFNRLPPDQAYFDALKAYGATWVRLSYDKWKPERRDFLLGNADHYTTLAETDLHTLRATLDRAQAAGLQVVIAPLSLPGARWSQNNHDRFDDRLWRDEDFWTQAATFWRDLALALKDHPAIAAYNLTNEPAPEKQGGLDEHASPAAMRAWYTKNADTPRDLLAFYTQIIKAIRAVDQRTPIMVDAGWYGAADSFTYWPTALPDTRVLYSFHMYEPYAATSAPNLKRATPYTYPGKVPFANGEETWNAQRVAAYLELPLAWAEEHNVPARRLVAGEFGCVRRLPGCRQYLEDVLTVFDHVHLHWAFYGFREDAWDGYDYELGSAPVPASYWKAIESGARDTLPRHPTPEFEPIRKRLH